eukprot:scaffold95997_cov14-Tisochrysis_lutea.AAC.1
MHSACGALRKRVQGIKQPNDDHCFSNLTGFALHVMGAQKVECERGVLRSAVFLNGCNSSIIMKNAAALACSSAVAVCKHFAVAFGLTV